MIYLTNRIQVLQYPQKKTVEHKEDYVKKWTSFGHIPWEHFDQPMNFSADPFIISLRIYIILNVWSLFQI